MVPSHVDGAHPHRAGAANAPITGSSPRIDADARARSQQLAAQFTAQIQQSMLESLAALGSDDEGEGGEGGEGDTGGDLGMGGGFDQQQLMATLFTGAQAQGRSAAQIQAMMSAFGASGATGTSGLDGAAGSELGQLAGAGAGSEALLAQQLIDSLGGTTTSELGVRANARTVAAAAREHGVDPAVAVAMMLVESGGRNTAVGDGGTSFGLFQLHQGGMLTAAGLTPDQAFDPSTNAKVALQAYRHEYEKGHARRTPGQIAAASQRPADPVGYAAKVDAAMVRARALLGP